MLVRYTSSMMKHSSQIFNLVAIKPLIPFAVCRKYKSWNMLNDPMRKYSNKSRMLHIPQDNSLLDPSKERKSMPGGGGKGQKGCSKGKDIEET